MRCFTIARTICNVDLNLNLKIDLLEAIYETSKFIDTTRRAAFKICSCELIGTLCPFSDISGFYHSADKYLQGQPYNFIRRISLPILSLVSKGGTVSFLFLREAD
jgi:hypothetical protein